MSPTVLWPIARPVLRSGADRVLTDYGVKPVGVAVHLAGRRAPSPADVPDLPPRRLLSGASGRPRADLRQQLEKRYEALESRAEGKSRARGFDVPM